MSDLHRAVEAELDAHTPTLTPPFEQVRARRRAREQHRAAGAVALSVVAVVGVALAATALGPAERATPQPGPAYAAATSTATSQPAAPAGDDANRYLDDLHGRLNDRGCAFVKGPDGGWSGLVSHAGVPYEEGQRRYAEARQACALSLSVAHRPWPGTPDGPAQIQITYTDPDAFDGVRDTPLLQAYLDLPGVSVPLDPDTQPPTYVVTAAGAQADALRHCLAGLTDLTVTSTSDPAPDAQPSGTFVASFIATCVGTQAAPPVPGLVGEDEGVASGLEVAVATPCDRP